jgi:hypothetical protein
MAYGIGDVSRPGALEVYADDAIDGLAGMARLDWEALDRWYEEDEQVFVHRRNLVATDITLEGKLPE